jgi:hypothetical protein
MEVTRGWARYKGRVLDWRGVGLGKKVNIWNAVGFTSELSKRCHTLVKRWWQDSIAVRCVLYCTLVVYESYWHCLKLKTRHSMIEATTPWRHPRGPANI